MLILHWLRPNFETRKKNVVVLALLRSFFEMDNKKQRKGKEKERKREKLTIGLLSETISCNNSMKPPSKHKLGFKSYNFTTQIAAVFLT